MKPTLATFLLLFLLTILLSSPSMSVAENTISLTLEQAQKEGIDSVFVRPGEIQESLTLNGEVSLNGDSIVHVSPRFPGIIKRVEKNLGDQVKAGDLLAVIQSNESLSSYEIRAEVSGTVIEKDATRGEFVKDDKTLFTLADLGVVWINAAIYPDQLSKVKVGNPVVVRSPSAGLQATSTISYVRLSLSEITRTALARIILDNSEHAWIPGMLVRVNVILSAHPVAMVLPRSAVQMVNNSPSVFRLSQSPETAQQLFELAPVTLGREDEISVEIQQGVTQGERIASGNTFLLKAELGKGSAGHED